MSLRTHHNFRKLSSFFATKVWTSVSEEIPFLLFATDNSLLPDCGRNLWTDPSLTAVKRVLDAGICCGQQRAVMSMNAEHCFDFATK